MNKPSFDDLLRHTHRLNAARRIVRHGRLFDAERRYIARQIEHQEKYDSAEEKKQVLEDSLQSFDAKIRREERDLRMTEDPEQE